MRENPANSIKDPMWNHLKDGGQEANIPQLKDAVYDMIQLMTQKDAGQRGRASNLPFETLETVQSIIIMEAMALVVSGVLDELPAI